MPRTLNGKGFLLIFFSILCTGIHLTRVCVCVCVGNAQTNGHPLHVGTCHLKKQHTFGLRLCQIHACDFMASTNVTRLAPHVTHLNGYCRGLTTRCDWGLVRSSPAKHGELVHYITQYIAHHELFKYNWGKILEHHTQWSHSIIAFCWSFSSVHTYNVDSYPTQYYFNNNPLCMPVRFCVTSTIVFWSSRKCDCVYLKLLFLPMLHSFPSFITHRNIWTILVLVTATVVVQNGNLALSLTHHTLWEQALMLEKAVVFLYEKHFTAL